MRWLPAKIKESEGHRAKGWEPRKKQCNQCSQCQENCSSLQNCEVIELLGENAGVEGAISSRDRANSFLIPFSLSVERNWWAIGAENPSPIGVRRGKKIASAFCPGNLLGNVRSIVGRSGRKSLRIMRDPGSSLKTRWRCTFRLIDSSRFWAATFLGFYFTALCNIRQRLHRLSCNILLYYIVY